MLLSFGIVITPYHRRVFLAAPRKQHLWGDILSAPPVCSVRIAVLAALLSTLQGCLGLQPAACTVHGARSVARGAHCSDRHQRLHRARRAPPARWPCTAVHAMRCSCGLLAGAAWHARCPKQPRGAAAYALRCWNAVAGLQRTSCAGGSSAGHSNAQRAR